MKYFIIICGILISESSFAYQGEFRSKGDSTSAASKTIIDTIFVPVPTDTMQFNVISKEFIPKQTFMQKHLGALLGSLGAGLVALFSVLATHKTAKKREKEKARIFHRNLLLAIYSELLSHEKLVDYLKGELNEAKRLALDKAQVLIESPHTKIPVEFINQCRIRLLEYEDNSMDLINHIFQYQNSTHQLVSNLSFSNVISLKEHFKNDAQYREGIKAYFDRLFVHLTTLENGRNVLTQRLLQEVERISPERSNSTNVLS